MPTQNTWTIKDILDWCEGFLANKGSHTARHDAQYLLGEAMGLSRIELYTNFDKPLSQAERAAMRDWVARRAAGEPLQLICGTAPFRHIVLEVAPGVLIPRPETEVLVSEVLALFPPPKQVSAFAFEGEALDGVEAAAIADASREAAEAVEAPEPAKAVEVSEPAKAAEVVEAAAIRVIDLCTGSGCIACALATEHPLMEVVATDIAPEALALAARNAQAQGVADRIQVVESNLLSALMQDPNNREAFDAIVSNPPYVPSGVVETLNPEVADFEPRLALDGGADGLELFRNFISDAHTLLKPGGTLAVELFETTLEQATKIACAHGFAQPRIVEDLAGKPRILLAYKA